MPRPRGIMTFAAIRFDVNTADILKWGIVLICGILVLGMLMLVARRYYRKAMAGDQDTGASDVENLRQMRDDGTVSDEEFSNLRRAALGLEPKGDEKIDTKSSIDGKGDDESGNVQDA